MQAIQNRLSPELLISAYSQGYFPMPDQNGTDIVWLKPDPRAIIPLDAFHVSRSLRKTIRRADYQVTYSEAFSEVIAGCATRNETWITPEFTEAYTRLHKLGFAHSVEVWSGDELVGGTYGVSVRGAFFAESMFHLKTDMSKVALFHLVERLNQQKYSLLECQFLTKHLTSLGATSISDREYMLRLDHALQSSCFFLGIKKTS